MSRGYGKGYVGDLNFSKPKNYKPLLAFVLIDELIFLVGVPLAGRLGVQMTFIFVLWAMTITMLIVLRMKKLTHPGFRAWVIIITSVVLTIHLHGILS